MSKSDTVLHELCKGFGALLSRSKQPNFIEEASRTNDRGNLAIHVTCSFQPTRDVVDLLLKAYPHGVSQPNSVGNLPLHQACMWQASAEVVELLLTRYTDACSVRNQYGSLPLHMAASNQASIEVVKLLIDAYPDALHLQNDDGMTPYDLSSQDETVSETILALLQGKPAPPEPSNRQKADKLEDRASALEAKLAAMKKEDAQSMDDLRNCLTAVRNIADRIPHALYSAGMDPNELEMSLSQVGATEQVILDMIKSRKLNSLIVKDRAEELLRSIVGLDHIKSQVRGIRRTTEICDLRDSLLPSHRSPQSPEDDRLSLNILSHATSRPRASHMVFVGNPGTGKTSVARLLAKAFHELGILRKPKFLECERMDLVARDSRNTLAKTQEVLQEARGGVLFIDEAYSLGLGTKSQCDTGNDAISELIRSIETADKDHPLIILAGFPMEMQQFLTMQGDLRKRFPVTFEFPDYTCRELSMIFEDLATAKGFDLDPALTLEVIEQLLENKTSQEWRSERNGRICELLLAGVRTEVRKRMRMATYEGEEDVDPHLIIKEDVENVVTAEFK